MFDIMGFTNELRNAPYVSYRRNGDKEEPKQYLLNIGIEGGKMIIEVQFNCADTQRIFNSIYEGGIVICDEKETDFINKVDNFIETELVRVKRNEKLNSILNK